MGAKGVDAAKAYEKLDKVHKIYDDQQQKVYEDQHKKVYEEHPKKVYADILSKVYGEKPKKVYEEHSNKVYDEQHKKVYDDHPKTEQPEGAEKEAESQGGSAGVYRRAIYGEIGEAGEREETIEASTSDRPNAKARIRKGGELSRSQKSHFSSGHSVNGTSSDPSFYQNQIFLSSVEGFQLLLFLIFYCDYYLHKYALNLRLLE